LPKPSRRLRIAHGRRRTSTSTKPKPASWAPHLHERMLITPVAGPGGLLAFFTVVSSSSGYRSTRSTLRPQRTGRRSPMQRSGAQPVRAERVLCSLRLSRPQDVREALYFLYPRSATGRLLRKRPVANLLGTGAIGPDLSQESKASSRLAARALLRPSDPLVDAADEIALLRYANEQLITYVETRAASGCCATPVSCTEARRHDEPGLSAAVHRFQGAHKRSSRNDKILNPPKYQLEEASTSRRSTEPLALGNPLPVTEQNSTGARKSSAALRRLPRHRRRRKGPGACSCRRHPRLHERRRRMLWRRTGPGDLLPHPPRLARDGMGTSARLSVDTSGVSSCS
jgi:hypothetical protein